MVYGLYLTRFKNVLILSKLTVSLRLSSAENLQLGEVLQKAKCKSRTCAVMSGFRCLFWNVRFVIQVW